MLELGEDYSNTEIKKNGEEEYLVISCEKLSLHTEVTDISLDCSEPIPTTSPAADPVEEQAMNDIHTT